MCMITTRCRMRHLIKLLKADQTKKVETLLQNPKYLDAIHALAEEGCVSLFYADNQEIPYSFFLLNSHISYLLKRSELWFNRTVGFIAGIASTLAAQFLFYLLTK